MVYVLIFALSGGVVCPADKKILGVYQSEAACDKYLITILGTYKDTRVSASTRITCEPWNIEKD